MSADGDAESAVPLRVGLNLLFLGERAGGAGRYARELVGALLEVEPQTEIELFLSRDAPADLSAEPWADAVRQTHVPVNLSGSPTHVPAEYLALPALALAHRLDVLHSPANTGPTRLMGLASVVSLLDLIWLHRPQEWEASPRVHRTMRRRVGRAVAGADGIFAISQAAAADISSTLGVASERIEVTSLGARPGKTVGLDVVQALRRQFELDDARVLLCVAQKRPYKNLIALIEALPELPSDVVLVLPGAVTSYEHRLRARAQELDVIGRVRFPDWLQDEQVEAMYACADVFVLPSLIEGFGLPVVEAMLRGVPVACSNTAALAEVAADAALLFDPERHDELVAAITRLLEDRQLASMLIERGHKRASQFTWRRTAERSLEGYRAAIAARAARR